MALRRPARTAAGRRRLGLAGAVSVALHLALLAGILFWGFWRRPARLPPPTQEVRVALVMKESRGHATQPRPARKRPPTPPRPDARPAPPAHPTPAPPTPPTPMPRMPAAAPPHPAPPPLPPTPPAPPGLQFNLGGNNAETNAIVHGSAVVPARPDARFRNLEPVYPRGAAERGETGTVTLLVHVGPDGTATEVDIARSSGFLLLDREARRAVARWHFLPALRHGVPVPAEMALRVNFSLH